MCCLCCITTPFLPPSLPPSRPALLNPPPPNPPPPTLCRLGPALDDLAARVQSPGGGVYLHCWGGRGRAGTIGACLLARLYGIGADEALER